MSVERGMQFKRDVYSTPTHKGGHSSFMYTCVIEVMSVADGWAMVKRINFGHGEHGVPYTQKVSDLESDKWTAVVSEKQ